MNKNLPKTTNQDIAKTLENLNKGIAKPDNNQLVFDPNTGEFVVANSKTEVSPDSVTINQIAQDGFAQ